MFDNVPGAFKYLVVGFVLIVLYQYATQERKIDAPGLASRDPWFEQHIYSESRPVLVKFGAQWCGPCRSLDANLQEIEPMIRERIKVVRVDVDEHQELASNFGVSSIPHSFVLYRGKIISERKGSMATASLKSWVEQSMDVAYRTPNP